jgi:hypothetical protein
MVNALMMYKSSALPPTGLAPVRPNVLPGIFDEPATDTTCGVASKRSFSTP